MNIFQSVTVKAPVVVLDAIPIDTVLPETVSPLFGIPTEILPSLLLKVFQSAEVKSPVTQLVAFAIEKLTFGHTLAPVPFVTESAGVEELIFQNVSVFCLLLKVFQSADESHPLDEVLACIIAACLLLNVFQSALERYPLLPLLACDILNIPEPEL